MRLIDADALKEDALLTSVFRVSLGDVRNVEDLIDDAPTIEAEPVRHGNWIKVAAYSDGVLNTAKCSLCNTFQAISNWDYYPYCMFCGAKMMNGKECVSRKCGTCSNDGWDMPQCRECNEENGFKWYKRKMDAEV